MKFKVLKHKNIPDIFGVFINHDEGEIRDADSEIYHLTTPELLGITATIDGLKKINQDRTAFHQLDDYDLVEVELIIKK